MLVKTSQMTHVRLMPSQMFTDRLSALVIRIYHRLLLNNCVSGDRHRVSISKKVDRLAPPVFWICKLYQYIGMPRSTDSDIIYEDIILCNIDFATLLT